MTISSHSWSVPWKNEKSCGVDRAQSSWCHKFYCSAVRVINDFSSSSFILFQGHWIPLSKNNLWIVAFIKVSLAIKCSATFSSALAGLGTKPWRVLQSHFCPVLSAEPCPTGRWGNRDSSWAQLHSQAFLNKTNRNWRVSQTVLKVRFPEASQCLNTQIINLIYSWKSCPASFQYGVGS